MESKAVVSLTNGKKAFGDNEVLKDISLTVLSVVESSAFICDMIVLSITDFAELLV